MKNDLHLLKYTFPLYEAVASSLPCPFVWISSPSMKPSLTFQVSLSYMSLPWFSAAACTLCFTALCQHYLFTVCHNRRLSLFPNKMKAPWGQVLSLLCCFVLNTNHHAWYMWHSLEYLLSEWINLCMNKLNFILTP